MAKTLKTRAELGAAINAELAKYDVCQGITVAIEKITDQRFDYNWDVYSSRASGTRYCRNAWRSYVKWFNCCRRSTISRQKASGPRASRAQRAVSQWPKPGFGTLDTGNCVAKTAPLFRLRSRRSPKLVQRPRGKPRRLSDTATTPNKITGGVAQTIPFIFLPWRVLRDSILGIAEIS